MKLAAPSISGVLSSCARQVWLDNLVKSASVDLQVDGVRVALGNADWPGQFFDLPAGTSLTAGKSVRARQQRGADASDWSRDSAKVQAVPNPLPPPVIPRPITACTAFVAVEGLVPGSDAVATFGGNQIGSAHASSSHAGIHLKGPLSAGQQVDVTVSACGPTVTVTSPPTEPFLAGQLDPPGVPDEVHACQRLVAFEQLLPGAVLVLTRGDGSVIEFGCESTSMTARLDPPLVPNETLRVHMHAAQDCEIKDSVDVPLKALTTRLAPPSVTTPLCPGTYKTTLSGLVPSAQVQVLVGSTVVLSFDAPAESTELDLAGVVLNPGDRVTVQQGLCGVFGQPNPVPAIVSTPADNDVLKFAKAAECALAVEVTGVIPGSLVSIFSATANGGRIGHAIAASSDVVVYVTPSLILHDGLTATAEGCGSQTATTNVEAVPGGAPIVLRAVEGDDAVDLGDCRLGALIDVLLDGRWAGWAIAVREQVRVSVRRPLVADQAIRSIARWCKEEQEGDPRRVAKRERALFSRATGFGSNIVGTNDLWKAGRVQAIAPLPGGDVIVGTESSGLWMVPSVGPAVSLSESWSEPHVHFLLQDPAVPNHIYAGTNQDLWYTDPNAPDPLRSWSRANLGALLGSDLQVNDGLLIPARGTLVLATSAGMMWLPVTPWPPTTRPQTDPAVSSGSFVSLAAGPNDSVVAYRHRNGLPGAVFVGSWQGNSLSWQQRMIQVLGDPDSRRAQIASGMNNGSLASAPSDRRNVYLATSGLQVPNVGECWFPVLHSSDGGLTWALESAGAIDELATDPSMGAQAYRNLAIAVHPLKANTILLGGRRAGLTRSDNSSADFRTPGYPDYGTPVNTNRFHSDVICVVFDPHDPKGDAVWVGSDGGIFRSGDTGKTWDESRNRSFPTLMFDQGGSMAPTLSANPAAPDVLAGGTQDNGFVYCPGDGREWRQIIGGDGYRAKFVTDDIVLLDIWTDSNVHWFHWDGSNLNDLGSLEPSGPHPAWLPWVATRVPAPDFRRNGATLVAVFGTDEPQGRVFGLFDAKPGTTDADRFRWELLATVPLKLTGLAALDGRIIVATTEGPNNTGSYFRIDTAANTFDAFVSGSLTNRGPARWPTFVGRRTVLAVDNVGVVRTDDLITWRDAGAAMKKFSGGKIQPFVVDTGPSPWTIYAGDGSSIFASNDGGSTWTSTSGLPAFADCAELEFVSGRDGSRRLVAATWNWSAWVARLQ